MKSDERHELATNELAQMIGDSVARLKPYISHVLIAIILVAVGVIVFQKYYKSSQDRTQEATLSLMPAVNAGVSDIPRLSLAEMLDRQISALAKYVENYPDSPVLDLARLGLANRLYDRGILARADETEAAEADGYLARAGEAFDQLKDTESRVGELARFGADCVVKARGNATEAMDRLTRLAEQKPDTLIANLADERVEIIRDAKPLELKREEKVEDKENKKEGEEQEQPESEKPSSKPAETRTPEAQNGSAEAEKREQESGKEE